MSNLKSYYASASLTEQIKNNDGLFSDVDERALFFKDDVSTHVAQLILDNYPYWKPDMPTDVTKSKVWQDLVGHNKTVNLMKQIRQGNMSELQGMTGIDTKGLEATGLENYENDLLKPAMILYLYANMGNGKSFFAALGAQLFLNRVIEQSSKEIEPTDVLGSNLQSLEGTKYSNNIKDLLYWLKNTDEDKLFIFDEASLYANSLSMSNTQKAYASLLPIVILIRMYSGRIIFIGHSGSDLGKQMRDMATVAKKDNKKKVTFYTGVDKQGEPYGKKYSMYSIPEMIEGAREQGLVPDTKDKGSWEWTEEDRELIEAELAGFGKTTDDMHYPAEDEDSARIDYPDGINTKTQKIKYMSNTMGMNQDEIADYFDMKQGSVSYHISK